MRTQGHLPTPLCNLCAPAAENQVLNIAVSSDALLALSYYFEYHHSSGWVARWKHLRWRVASRDTSDNAVHRQNDSGRHEFARVEKIL